MRQNTLRSLLLIAAALLVLRLPFLNQAIQGDEYYYLKGAEHALVDPLHPNHVRYLFQGVPVDMRGHTHPPFNSWMLALLLAIFGRVNEPAFHAVYVIFSAIAVFSVWSIARRYTREPLAATLLFLVTPAFVVNGASLEADLPFVAFWLAAIALFLEERFWLAALAGCLAGITAYQSVILTPVLLLWNRRRAAAWCAALAPPAAVFAYQMFERTTGGSMPASVLAGYMGSYHLQTLVMKVRNAAALLAHSGWIVFPPLAVAAFRRWWIAGVIAAGGALFFDLNPLFWVSAGCGAMLLAASARQWRDPLAQWILIFFAAALVIFFAGSARYLLPVAAPVAILVSRTLPRRWTLAGAAAGAVVPLGLAVVNYQHWDAYRHLRQDAPRVFSNAEWGARHYLESQGARPVRTGQGFWPGDALIESSWGVPLSYPGLKILKVEEVQSRIPLRIIGLGAQSAYSSVSFGLRPFDISLAPLDRIKIAVISDLKPELSALKIGTPEAAAQIVSGVFNQDRWTTDKAVVILKRPSSASFLQAVVFVPPQSPARSLSLAVDGKIQLVEPVAAPGVVTLKIPAPQSATPTVTLSVDRTFSVPGDQRQLGVILTEIGFK